MNRLRNGLKAVFMKKRVFDDWRVLKRRDIMPI